MKRENKKAKVEKETVFINGEIKNEIKKESDEERELNNQIALDNFEYSTKWIYRP